MRLHRTLIETPVGPLRAIASDAALCALEFYDKGRIARLDARLARWFGATEVIDGSNTIIETTCRWLRDYFDGRSADTRGLPLEMRGAPFELKVWRVLTTIEPGATITYGAVAKQLGSPTASRAVGMANGANPLAIVVPCHRVIGANGTLTGYGGGLDRKKWLLEHESRWAKERRLF